MISKGILKNIFNKLFTLEKFNMKNFIFYKSDFDIESLDKASDKWVYIKKCINTKSELYEPYKIDLEFPDYFGENWDAFYDCIRDLSWISEKTVNIFHEDAPFMDNKDDFKMYVITLFQAVETWEARKNHEIIVHFPIEFQPKIQDVISAYLKIHKIKLD